ncbi:hypothetical protein EDD15DRAFT_2529649 [Pisolithus albus]|nr:hypothetical protein EDD15DRAFT_2529649 [Pisolithus albus]
MEADDTGLLPPQSILDYVAVHTPSGLPPHSLHIHVGGIYRLTRNLSIERSLAKNSRVVVTSLGQRIVAVKTLQNNNDPYTAENIPIPRITFTSTLSSGHTLQRRQFPLAPAYATTFNSCQGLTLDSVGIDLTKPVFSHGQLYTAFSRIRHRDNARILLSTKDNTATNVTFHELLLPPERSGGVSCYRLSDFVAEYHRENSTLGSIRGFLGDEIQKLPHPVENRILTVTTSDLQRSVAYFWSPHDFVRGVIGALLGHEYLCEIGILHCDISENNIVLSLCRGGLGALIDFDMAIVNMHRDSIPPSRASVEELCASVLGPPAPLLAGNEPYKAQLTASNCLSIHTLWLMVVYRVQHQSFLYVLMLFFFSYKGPLEKETLREARVRGFTQPVGAGRLRHVTAWPAMFQCWASGTLKEILAHKSSALMPDAHTSFVKEYFPHLQSRWEPASQSTLPAVLNLIVRCWNMFSLQDRRVTHHQFIEVLETWLEQYADEEANYVYPFDD